MLIDLLISNSSKHFLEGTCIPGVMRAFEELGIQTRPFYLDHEMSTYLSKRGERSFTFIDPIKRELPLSDLFQTPTVHWEIGSSLSPSVHLIRSRWTRVCYGDHSLKHENLLSFCPGVDPLWEGEKEKHFDTVCFDSLICKEAKWESYQRLFSTEALTSILEIPENFLSLPPNTKLSHNDWLYAIEELEKAERVQRLVKSFKTPFHLFGEHVGKNWLKRLPNASHIFLHSALPFSEYIEVLKQAHFLVVDQPQSFAGHPFWALVAPLCGALPLVPFNSLLIETFGTSAFCYQDEQSLQERLLYFKSHAKEKKELIEQMKKVVLSHFTWKHRMKEIEKIYASF
jgi:hypothetical protein